MHSGVKTGVKWFTQRMVVSGTIFSLIGLGTGIFSAEHAMGFAVFAFGIVLAIVGIGIQKACGIDPEERPLAK
jgi:hypothetical protein